MHRALSNRVFGVLVDRPRCQQPQQLHITPSSLTTLTVVGCTVPEFYLVQASEASHIPFLNLLGALSYLRPSLDSPLVSTPVLNKTKNNIPLISWHHSPRYFLVMIYPLMTPNRLH